MLTQKEFESYGSKVPNNRDDILAIGKIFFFLLTGDHPKEKETLLKLPLFDLKKEEKITQCSLDAIKFLNEIMKQSNEMLTIE